MRDDLCHYDFPLAAGATLPFDARPVLYNNEEYRVIYANLNNLLSYLLLLVGIFSDLYIGIFFCALKGRTVLFFVTCCISPYINREKETNHGVRQRNIYRGWGVIGDFEICPTK